MKKYKECKKHGLLNEDQIAEEKINWGIGIYFRCKICKQEKDYKWNHENMAHKIAYSKEWKLKNKTKVNEWNKQDRLKNPEKYKEWSRRGRERLGLIRSLKDVTRIRGITLEQYYAMVGRQENLCAICGYQETRKNKNGDVARLCIDHCHRTGNVRELLCHSCNTGIGKFMDDINLLKAAIAYLEKHTYVE